MRRGRRRRRARSSTTLPAGAPPETAIGLGIYLGLVAATVLVLFGLTIVVKRVPSAYAAPEDDDI